MGSLILCDHGFDQESTVTPAAGLPPKLVWVSFPKWKGVGDIRGERNLTVVAEACSLGWHCPTELSSMRERLAVSVCLSCCRYRSCVCV